MNFIHYLFENSQDEADREATSEELSRLFESLGSVEELETRAKPLAAALKAAGIENDLEASVGEMHLTLPNEEAFQAAMAKLAEPDAMVKLAEEGWAAAPGGEGNTIHFVCLTVADEADGTHNEHAKVNLDKLIKTAAEDDGMSEPEVVGTKKKEESESPDDVINRLLEGDL